MKHQSRLALLREAIREWQKLPRVSQRVIAVSVVEKVNALGFKDTLADMGISFVCNDCPYDDARINAQRLFRWLGTADYGQYLDMGKLWLVEQPIAAAMPEEIRNKYWNAICSPTGSMVTKSCGKEGKTDYHIPTLLTNVLKESSEGHIAIAQLEGDQTPGELRKHLNEVAESIAAFQSAHDVIKGMIEEKEGETQGATLKAI